MNIDRIVKEINNPNVNLCILCDNEAHNSLLCNYHENNADSIDRLLDIIYNLSIKIA